MRANKFSLSHLSQRRQRQRHSSLCLMWLRKVVVVVFLWFTVGLNVVLYPRCTATTTTYSQLSHGIVVVVVFADDASDWIIYFSLDWVLLNVRQGDSHKATHGIICIQACRRHCANLRDKAVELNYTFTVRVEAWLLGLDGTQKTFAIRINMHTKQRDNGEKILYFVRWH